MRRPRSVEARLKASAMEFDPRCPSCSGRVPWEGNPHRPFCSERCQLADLGGWVMEQYRIPGRSLGADAPDDDPEENGTT